MRTLEGRYPEAEVIEGTETSPQESALPHVVCCGRQTDVVAGVDKLVVTRDAVRGWLDEGLRPSERSGRQGTVVVVDRPTADAALVAWGSGEARPNRQDAVTVAEELAGCTGFGVVLTGTTIIHVRGNKTGIVRTTTEAGRAQGMPEVIAGAVAAARWQDDLQIQAALALVACAAVAEDRDPGVVPRAQQIAARQRRVLHELRQPGKGQAPAR